MKVRFHLPDFTVHCTFNLVFAEMIKKCPQYFREGVEIASVYGVFPPAIWNGGRFQSGRCDIDFVKYAINAFNKRGIPLRFTFTNPVLEEKHLHDEFCNTIMRLADNGLNEVIVVSPILEDYIRDKYPKFKLTSSTCKRITDPEKLSEELEKDYHIVVVDYDLNNKFDVLEKIQNKEKCELLVNACCNPECKLRQEHYRSIGAEQLAFGEHLQKHPDKDFHLKDYKKYADMVNMDTFKCTCMDKTIFEIKDHRTHISPDAIWDTYVPMGFSQFKIEGRTLELFNLIEHYMYYMIKPECRDEARLLLMYQLMNQGVIKTKY